MWSLQTGGCCGASNTKFDKTGADDNEDMRDETF